MHKFEKFMQKTQESLTRATKIESFIEHFQNKYNNQKLPSWMMFQLLTFSQLAKFLNNIHQNKYKLWRQFENF